MIDVVSTEKCLLIMAMRGWSVPNMRAFLKGRSACLVEDSFGKQYLTAKACINDGYKHIIPIRASSCSNAKGLSERYIINVGHWNLGNMCVCMRKGLEAAVLLIQCIHVVLVEL